MKVFGFILLTFFVQLPLPRQAPGQSAPKGTVAQAAEEKPKPDLPNYLEVTPSIATGGQPTDAGLRTLAERGYTSIINLRTNEERVDLAAEEKSARELGLGYFPLPAVGTAPEARQAFEFMNLLQERKDGRVFVHCATANRVGAFMMIYRVLRDGLSPEKAEEEAGRIGLRSDVLRKFARDFIARHPNPQ
jgi:protein tyrosine phosphatase (PTP) superfamily phosphohydrolase (DUF442 family)